MNSKKEVQHVYLVGAKSLGAYGGYETFVYKLTEYALRTFGCLAIIAWHVKANTGFSTGGGY